MPSRLDGAAGAAVDKLGTPSLDRLVGHGVKPRP